MSLRPLLNTPLIIQIHAFGAMAAFFLGLVQFAALKGTLPHKSLGLVWLLLMAVIATSIIFIRPSLSPGLPITQWFSFIHIFTVLAFYGIIRGTYFLLRGGSQLKRHREPFAGMFVGGLVIAGGIAFLPGRPMNAVVFGG